MSIHLEQYQLGKKIGEMYLAAQGISLTASNAALDALEGASLYMQLGFEQIIQQANVKKQIPYKVVCERGLLCVVR